MQNVSVKRHIKSAQASALGMFNIFGMFYIFCGAHRLKRNKEAKLISKQLKDVKDYMPPVYPAVNPVSGTFFQNKILL